MANSNSWEKIFEDYHILEHDFSKSYFPLSADQIKISCQNFKKTAEKEVRILCKQDTRESRPDIFKQNGLFILPTKNMQGRRLYRHSQNHKRSTNISFKT